MVNVRIEAYGNNFNETVLNRRAVATELAERLDGVTEGQAQLVAVTLAQPGVSW